MIEMAQFYNIKFLKEVEGLSQRLIVTKLGISRNTVSKYLKENIAPTTVLRKTVYRKAMVSGTDKRQKGYFVRVESTIYKKKENHKHTLLILHHFKPLL
jgi:transcriptional regulator with XRE-family HTH domain